MSRRPLVLLILLALPLSTHLAHPQSAPGLISGKPDYSKEAVVGELLSVKVRFENDGTSVIELAARVRIQSDAGVQRYGLQTFTYQGATQNIEIDYVRVRKADGSIVTTPPDNVQDLDAGITREAPFYSDLRQKHVAVKGLSAGDTLEYLVRWRATKSLAPGQFWYSYDFERSAVVLDEELEVSLPIGRAVKVKSPSLSPSITEQVGRRIYAWKTSNSSDHSKENETAKAIDAKLGRLPPPDVQISSFQSWNEVGKWYWGLQQDRIQPTSDVRAKASELTKGTGDSNAAIHNIYDFVSTKFRYIGVAFGIGRYQPHPADDVLGNQYGDCKDKHTLFASLLQASGATAYPALISTTHRLDPDVPSPGQFDHVISAIPQGKDFQWLDTTTELGPFGYLPPQIRDKQALVIPANNPAVLATTPAELPFQSFIKFSVDAKLSSVGTLDSKMEYSSRGDDELAVRAVFRRVSQAQWKDLVQQISFGLGFGGTVSDVTAGSIEDTMTPMHFSYSYSRKEYSDWADRQINMPGLPLSLPAVSEDEAHANDPIYLGPRMQMITDAKVELLMGYLAKMPDDVTLTRDYADYKSTYSQDNGVLISHRELKIKLSQVPDAERADYKQFAKSISDDGGRYVVLSTSSSKGAQTTQDPVSAALSTALRTLPGSNNEEAGKFEKEGLNAMGPDQPAAVSALKRAVASDPKFTRAWVTLGSLYMAMSQSDSAIDAYHKAIDSDPQQLVTYRLLAFTLLSMHRTDEAIPVWQSLLKVAPEDLVAMENLSQLLYSQKRYADVIPFLQTAIRLIPEATGAKLYLAVSYLKTGETDKGDAMLSKLLKADASSWDLNFVAYELAEANVKLPEALDAAEKAVQMEESASEEIHLDSLTEEDLHSTQSIGSFWDTLGWVEFRLGRLDEAEKYLQASWMLSQQAVVADHLGQVYEQKKRRQEAIHMYRFALWISSSPAGGANRDEYQKHLSNLVPGEKPLTGIQARLKGPSGDELSEMRRVKVARITPKQASAELFLLFGPGGKLEDVKFISGADELKQAGKTLRAASFPVPYPDGSKAHLVRRGILSCTTTVGCSFVLYTPSSVNSVD